MGNNKWFRIGVVGLLILAYAFFSSNTEQAAAKLPKDLSGYKLEALADGKTQELTKIANGRAMVVVFATPT